MRSFVFVAVALFGAVAPLNFAVACLNDQDAVAKELKVLEGAWAQEPPKSGNGRVYTFVFKDGKLFWSSTLYKGGRPEAANDTAELRVKVNPTAAPKELILTTGEKEHLVIYEITGATMKVTFGSLADRPKKFDETNRLNLTLKRKK